MLGISFIYCAISSLFARLLTKKLGGADSYRLIWIKASLSSSNKGLVHEEIELGKMLLLKYLEIRRPDHCLHSSGSNTPLADIVTCIES